MAYSSTLNYVVGDTLPVLELKLKDRNTAASGATLDPDDNTTWAPINITGATVKLRIRELGSTDLHGTLTCTITGATAGECATNFAAAPFTSSGTYEGEVEIEFSGSTGKQTVFDLVKFKVRDDFD